MDPSKIEKVMQMKPPQSIKQLQTFLGLTGYYRRFIKDYAKISFSLMRMLRKDVLWEWDPNANNSFEELKKKLTEYPILRCPDFYRQFWIYTDASGFALGAVLSQKDHNGAYMLFPTSLEP
jgi:hypothetical protein